MKSRLRQSGHEEIGPGQAPDDLSLSACDNSGDEQCGCRSVHSAGSAARKFVKSAMRKTASRKYGVDFWHAKRKAARPLRSPAFHGGDAFAKVSKNMLADGRHRSRILSKSR
jgi:hypothetical protein